MRHKQPGYAAEYEYYSWDIENAGYSRQYTAFGKILRFIHMLGASDGEEVFDHAKLRAYFDKLTQSGRRPTPTLSPAETSNISSLGHLSGLSKPTSSGMLYVHPRDLGIRDGE